MSATRSARVDFPHFPGLSPALGMLDSSLNSEEYASPVGTQAWASLVQPSDGHSIQLSDLPYLERDIRLQECCKRSFGREIPIAIASGNPLCASFKFSTFVRVVSQSYLISDAIISQYPLFHVFSRECRTSGIFQLCAGCNPLCCNLQPATRDSRLGH